MKATQYHVQDIRREETGRYFQNLEDAIAYRNSMIFEERNEYTDLYCFVIVKIVSEYEKLELTSEDWHEIQSKKDELLKKKYKK